MLVLAGLARISGHFLVVFQVMFGFYHVNLLLCIINQIIQQNSLINTMYKREKATTVTRGMYSSSKHWTVNENMAKREEGCLHRVHLLIITYITSNDVWKAFEQPNLPLCTGFNGTIDILHLKSNWSKLNAQIAIFISQFWVVLKVPLPPHSVPWLETDAFADLEVIHRIATLHAIWDYIKHEWITLSLHYSGERCMHVLLCALLQAV